MEHLHRHAAIGAFHNSRERRDAPKCHPHTRMAVINEIMEWVTDSLRPERFLWIYGPAGSGKSSIAQTIAEYCEARGFLASDYFFSRMTPGRNTDVNLIPTLACQLTVSIPDICVHMAAAIDHDSLIFSRSLSTQLDALVVRPLTQWMLSNQIDKDKVRPNLIIIDGLDECQPPDSQRHILSSLHSVCRNSSIPLVFLIASRPEQVIRDMFNGELHPRRADLYWMTSITRTKTLKSSSTRNLIASRKPTPSLSTCQPIGLPPPTLNTSLGRRLANSYMLQPSQSSLNLVVIDPQNA